MRINSIPQWKWWTAILLIIVYTLFAIVFTPTVKGTIGGLSAVPVVIIAWLLGIRWGIISGIVLGSISAVIQTFYSTSSLSFVPLLIISMLLGGGSGLAIGYIRNQRLALQQTESHLEQRVQEQTAELSALVKQLQTTLAERQQVERKLKDSLYEKELLLKEIHHRVKNNMQVIVSMMSLQSAYITQPQLLDIFTDSQNRVRSMALVHEKLYQSQNLAQIDFRDYLQHLVSTLFHSYSPHTSNIDLTFDIGDIALGVDAAIPCGLIVNELVSNTLKHAFPASAGGVVKITLKELTSSQLELVVDDNGIGFPEGKDWRRTETLGMQLVLSLVKQLNGTIGTHSLKTWDIVLHTI